MRAVLRLLILVLLIRLLLLLVLLLLRMVPAEQVALADKVEPKDQLVPMVQPAQAEMAQLLLVSPHLLLLVMLVVLLAIT